MTEDTTQEKGRVRDDLIALAVNQVGAHIDKRSHRTRMAPFEDAIETTTSALINADTAGVLAVIEVTTDVSKSVAEVYEQISWSLTMGFPTLDLMLERDAASAVLGAVVLTLSRQVEAAIGMLAEEHGLTEDDVDEFEHPVATALGRMLEMSPFCDHTAKWTLSTVTGHKMYAEPLDRVASTLGTAVNWHKEA